MITSHPQVVRLVLSADACSIGPGESVSLNVKGFDARGGEIVLTDLRWALADPAKGTLRANGAQAVFTAAPGAAGTVTISVRSAGRTASWSVKISNSNESGSESSEDCDTWVWEQWSEPRPFLTGLKVPYPDPRTNLQAAIAQADWLIGWQLPHGGWWKNWENSNYRRAWNGREGRSELKVGGVEAGTIDNGATVREILYLAWVYRETGEDRFKSAVLRGIGFLLAMQYPSGGWPQVYPLPSSSSDYRRYVTYNDNAMINVMELLYHARNRFPPFDAEGLITADYIKRIDAALDKGVRYILDSQIRVNGVLTAWCAQHDPYTGDQYARYAPRPGRAYEPVSISGNESVMIVRFLMEWPEKSPEIEEAIRAAVQWFDQVKVVGMRYVSGDPQEIYFHPDPNSTIWYRFYEIGSNRGIFGDRDGRVAYSIKEISKERRDGYSWAGPYARDLLPLARERGYL